MMKTTVKVALTLAVACSIAAVVLQNISYEPPKSQLVLTAQNSHSNSKNEISNSYSNGSSNQKNRNLLAAEPNSNSKSQQKSSSSSQNNSKSVSNIIPKNDTKIKKKTKEQRKKEQDDDLDKTPDVAFTNLVARYNKNVKDTKEYMKRKTQFDENIKKIKSINNKTKGKEKFKLGINQFSDWSPDEIKAILTFQPIANRPEKGNATFPPKSKRFLDTMNASIDWREQGAVSTVKEQGKCGSCYAFASAGAIEGAYKLKTGILVEFSTQQILDCTGGTYRNYGCSGGNMEKSFSYLKTNYHMPASQYPYVGAQKNCSYDATKGLLNTLGYQYLAKNNPNAMMQALQYGPVSAALEATSDIFMFYSSGILTNSACGPELDHAVLIVGYGTDDDGTPYWTVKNFWGEDWGEYGYIRILRDLQAGSPGVCGINQYVIVPLIAQNVILPLSNSPSYLNEFWTPISSDSPDTDTPDTDTPDTPDKPDTPDSLALLTQATCAAGFAFASIAAFSF